MFSHQNRITEITNEIIDNVILNSYLKHDSSVVVELKETNDVQFKVAGNIVNDKTIQKDMEIIYTRFLSSGSVNLPFWNVSKKVLMIIPITMKDRMTRMKHLLLQKGMLTLFVLIVNCFFRFDCLITIHAVDHS